MEYFFKFLLALSIFSFPFLLALLLVRKTTIAKNIVMFLFLLVLPIGFAAWVFCSAIYNIVKSMVSGYHFPESGVWRR